MAAVRRLCGEGDRYFLSRYQVASGLRLQMLLYFNVYVAVMYAIMHPLIFQWKATTWPPRIIVAVCQVTLTRQDPNRPRPSPEPNPTPTLTPPPTLTRAPCSPCQPMFFYVWLVMEPIRLIVGHVGNLGERVAWLAPFWIVMLFPNPNPNPNP